MTIRMEVRLIIIPFLCDFCYLAVSITVLRYGRHSWDNRDDWKSNCKSSFLSRLWSVSSRFYAIFRAMRQTMVFWGLAQISQLQAFTINFADTNAVRRTHAICGYHYRRARHSTMIGRWLDWCCFAFVRFSSCLSVSK